MAAVGGCGSLSVSQLWRGILTEKHHPKWEGGEAQGQACSDRKGLGEA